MDVAYAVRDLDVSAELQVPTSAPGAPAAGDIWESSGALKHGASSKTVADLETEQTFTQAQTVTAPATLNKVALTLKGHATAATNVLEVFDSAGSPALQSRFDSTGEFNTNLNLKFKSGTSFTGTLDHGITADRTFTFPDASATLATTATPGTSGSDLNWSATGVLNLPDAGTGARGAVTTGAQSFAGAKTFAGGVIIPDNTTFIQDNSDATKQLQFQASGIATGTTRTLTAPNLSGTIALTDQAQTISGANTFTGDVLVKDLNNVRFADQFAGANAGAKIAAAIADLPATGGTVDARAFEGAQTFTSTLTIDKPVKLLLGCATFNMTGGATELVKITCAGVEIEGMGWDSILEVGAAVAGTVDAIRVAPTGLAQGLYLHDFRIKAESGTPGRYGINFDNTTQYIQYVKVERLRIDTLGSYAIALVNPTPLADGALATSTIENCIISGGVNLDSAGDSLRILNNTITGPREILIKCVTGASDQGAHGFLLEGNNITSTGNIRVINGTSGQIIRNNIEAVAATTSANSALIDIDGTALSRVTAFTIQGNYLGANSAYIADTIRVNYADATMIRENMSVGGSGVVYRITANAVNTQIHDDRSEPYGQLPSSIISDAGVKTTIHHINPGTNGFETVLNDLSIGCYNRTTAGTTDSKKLYLTGSSHDGSAHVPEFAIFQDVTTNAGGGNLIFQRRLDAGAFDTLLSLSHNATDSLLTLGSATTANIVASSGTVLNHVRAVAGAAAQIGSSTAHRTDIIANNVIGASIGTGQTVSLGGLVGGTAQLSLTSTGKIGWDDGAGTIDTTLERTAADQINIGDGSATNTAYGATAGTVVGKLLSDSGGAVRLGATSNHRTDIVANNVIGASISTSQKMSLGGLTGGSEQLSLTSAGKIGWDDGAATIDTNLYRSAANTLKTDDAFVVASTLAVTGATTLSSTISYRDLTEVVNAVNTITAAESGSVFFLDSGVEFDSVLPAPAAGLHFTFIIKGAPSGASYTITTNGAANIIKGQVYTVDVNSATDPDFETTGVDVITFVDSKAVAGDRVELFCDGTNWYAYGFCSLFDAITFS